MAMSMQELFYGHSEPVYFLQPSYAPEHRMDRFQQASYAPEHHGRRMDRFDQAASYAPVRERRIDRFDLMVPMCCARCEHEIRNALFALRGVRDVVCDARNQRVTVTGFLEPALALKQVRRVKDGATLQQSLCYSSDAYSRRFCPAYRNSTETHYMSFNPPIEIRVENEYC